MRLERIQVSQFRNLADQEIELDSGLNLLLGANGHGKSSLLESVYLLGTSRSFRTAKIADVVRFGGGPARVAGEGAIAGEVLSVLISKDERQYLRHGKRVTPAEYIGTLDVVALSSDLVQGFRRQPAERRRFLDRMATVSSPVYLNELRDLRRACAQRAEIASSGRKGPERAAWDRRAAELALPVVKRRKEMAEALEQYLRQSPGNVFPEGPRASMRLVSRPRFEPQSPERYVDQLAAAFAAQEPSPSRRETPTGPLRDDLAVDVDGKDLMRFGSSGQVRSLLAALVLAEMRRIRGLKGRYPVLVLDDVDADLDEGRLGALLRTLGAGAQVLAAISKGRLAGGLGESGRRFRIENGRVAPA